MGAFPLGGRCLRPRPQTDEENLPDITHERAIPVNSPLISLPQAADCFPLGGSQRRKFLKISPRLQYRSRGIRFSIQKVKARGGVGTDK